MIVLDEQTRLWIRRHYDNLVDLRNELLSTGRSAVDSRFPERLDLAIRQLRYASALHHDKTLFVAANSWLSRLSRFQEQTGAWGDEDWAQWLDQVIRYVETREMESANRDAPQAQADSRSLPKVLVIGSQRLFDLLNGNDAPSGSGEDGSGDGFGGDGSGVGSGGDGSGGEPEYVLDYADWSEWETAIHQEMILDRQTFVLLHARTAAGDLPNIIRHIRETGALAHLPVAVVAEDMDSQQLAELYESPADLVLPGSVDARILRAAIRKLLGGSARDAGRTLAEDREQLIRLVNKEWQRYIRFQSPFAVVYVSLEQYPYLLQRHGAKQVNETAYRMFELSRGSIRTSDEIRRWKANAFVLLLPMANKEGGQLVAQRIFARFSRELGTSPLYPYMRIGVTEGERGYERAEDIIRRLERQVVMEAVPGTLYVSPALSKREQPAHKIKVLIVDDDLVTPVLLQNHLNRAEWEVQICTDSSRALEQAIQFRPQIILSDIHLEGNNGFSFCLQCRQIYSRREAVFMFLSHQNTTSNIVRSVQVGADDFIAKPFSAAEVEARMRMHWNLRASLDHERKTDGSGKDKEATA